MSTFLANFTAAAGTTIGSYTSDSGHSFGANTALVISNANSLYINNVSGSLTSEILGFTTDAAYELTLTIRKLTDSGNVGVFIGDAPLQNGYLFVAAHNGAQVNTRVFKYVSGAFSSIPLGWSSAATESTLRVTADKLELLQGGSVVATSTDTTFARGGQTLFLRLGVAGTNTTAYHMDALEVVPYATPTPPYPPGTYPLSVTATAPDTSTNTDTGTLQVVDKLPVNNSKVLKWDTTSAVSNSNDLIWSVFQPVITQVQTDWNILSATGNSSNLEWSLLNRTEKSVQAQWSMLQSCLNQADLQWSMRTSAANLLEINWNDLESVLNSSTIEWSIISPVSTSAQVDWDLQAALSNVANSASISWALLASVNNSIDIDYDLLSSLSNVSNSAQLIWDMAGKISAQLESEWNVLNSVGSSKELLWSVSEAVAQQIQANWHLLQSANKDVQLVWDSAGITSQGIQLNWMLQTDSVRIPLHVMVIKKQNRIMKILH